MKKLEIGGNLTSLLLGVAFVAAMAAISIFGNDTQPKAVPQQPVQTTGAQK